VILALSCFLFVVSILILRTGLILGPNPSHVNIIPTPSTGAERVHNLNNSFNYTTIQAAIFAPDTVNGDVIGVDEGTYIENINVKKPDIKSLGRAW
jgi:hypothetical protein